MAFIHSSQTKFNFLSHPECLSLAEIADVTGIPHVDPYDALQPICCLSRDVICHLALAVSVQLIPPSGIVSQLMFILVQLSQHSVDI